jgi:hypothetical protein
MAEIDAAVVTAAVGYILRAPEGTAAPTPTQIDNFDPAVGLTNWDSVGHTSADDLPELGNEGGDTEVKGSWQNSALRTVQTSALVDFVTFKMLQFDSGSLALYYGQANGSGTPVPRKFRVSKSGGVTRSALLIIIVDGDTKIGLYAPKTDIRRDDSISLATDEFGTLPVRATFLEYTDTTTTPAEKVLFDWLNVEEPDDE